MAGSAAAFFALATSLYASNKGDLHPARTYSLRSRCAPYSVLIECADDLRTQDGMPLPQSTYRQAPTS